MTLEDYYKIAEERIGQYDGYGFRCKQWLVPVLSAFVVVAFRRREMVGKLMLFGSVIIFLLFLVEMSYQVVCKRLIDYASLLEERMSENPQQDVSCSSLEMGGFVSLDCRRDLCDYICFVVKMSYRVRGLIPYLVAIVILCAGVYLAAQLGNASN